MWRIWTLHECLHHRWHHSLLYSGFSRHISIYLIFFTCEIFFYSHSCHRQGKNWDFDFPKHCNTENSCGGESQEKCKCILFMYSIWKAHWVAVLYLSLPSVLHTHSTEQSSTYQWHCGFNLVLTYCSLPVITHVRNARFGLLVLNIKLFSNSGTV